MMPYSNDISQTDADFTEYLNEYQLQSQNDPEPISHYEGESIKAILTWLPTRSSLISMIFVDTLALRGFDSWTLKIYIFVNSSDYIQLFISWINIDNIFRIMSFFDIFLFRKLRFNGA